MHFAMESLVVLCTSLNNDLMNDGVIIDAHNRVTDKAIEMSFKIPLSQTQTPRRFFLVAQNLVPLT